jgi:branched-chain amino acid transport system ATP-binding protein
MLNIKDLSAGYGETQVLRNVNMSIDDGKIIGIVGSNGAGKTTLIRSIMGMTNIYSGSITMNDVELTKIPPQDVVKHGIGLVMEGRGLFSKMTVEENLLIGGINKVSRPHRKEQLKFVLEMFPALKDKMRRMAGSLSGGEQQMLAIGRGLMTTPKLLILDEVSLGLAPMIVEQIYKMLVTLKERGTSLMVVEQNVYLCLEVADYAYVIENGRVTSEGDGMTLLNDSMIKEKYLGI